MDIVTKYVPTDRQIIAHESPHRYKLYGGAMGGGKTRWLCEEMKALMLEYPGNRGLMARFRLTDFKSTTLVTLLQAIEPELLVDNGHNKTEHTIEFKNGSIIKYTGLSDEDGVKTLKSFECGAFAIDEASEISFENFKIATTRLRWKLPTEKHPRFFGLLASNPEDCWLKDTFVDGKGGTDYIFVPALPRDNPHNPPEYVNQMRKDFGDDELFIKRYLEGQWDDIAQGNFVIDRRDLEAAVHKDIVWENKVGIGIDVARFGEDETAIYVLDSGRYVTSNFSMKRGTDETSLLAQRMIIDNDAQITCIDDIGVGGGVTDMLGSYLRMDGVIGINVGRRSEDDRFFNQRAQLWWYAREMFKAGKISLPNDPRLIRQLGAVMYNYRGSGKVIVEPKDDTKRRIGQSPDRADAFILALWATKQIAFSANDFRREDNIDLVETADYGWAKWYSK